MRGCTGCDNLPRDRGRARGNLWGQGEGWWSRGERGGLEMIEGRVLCHHMRESPNMNNIVLFVTVKRVNIPHILLHEPEVVDSVHDL